MMRLFPNSRLVLLLTAATAFSIISQSAYAQQYRDQRYVDEVIVYEDCDFRGDSRAVPIGEFRSMSAISFGNDRISSIRVPRGLEVIIYQDDKFRGDYARIDRDISCFDRSWNDEVSSLVVKYKDRRDNRRGDRRNDDDYDNRDRRDDRRSGHRGDDRNGDTRGTRNIDNSNVTAKNITRVVFDNRVLQQLNKRQWQIVDRQYGVSQFRETRRDRDAVYLENEYTNEKVRIDLFANDVTFTKRNGRSQRYAIQRKQSTLRPAPVIPPAPARDDVRPGGESLKTYIVTRNGCFRYTARTRGGEGGIRFHGKGGFERFNKKAHKGRMCHNGPLTMEINKTNPKTNVIVTIHGQQFSFAPNETPTAYKNTWYRKHVVLTVARDGHKTPRPRNQDKPMNSDIDIRKY